MTPRTPGVARLGALVLAVFLGVELITYQRAQTLLKRHQDLVRRTAAPSSQPVFSQRLANESQAFLNQHLLQALVASLLLLVVFRLTIVQQERELDRFRELGRHTYELTENMPAGTYVLTLSPRGEGEVDLHFRFASTRFLEIFGVNREAVFSDPNVVLEAIHPDDLASMNAANARAFASGEPFHWEGRLQVGGSTRWYAISSNPRQAADGVTVWEGVVSDNTERVTAQQELEHSLQREMENEQQHRTLLEQKLKTSLTAAAMVHEIKQPLAAVLINARLASRELANLPAAVRPAALERRLEALAVDGDLAVEAMERIRMLLRNVETKPTPIDITSSVDSALLYLETELRQGGVTVHVEGMGRPCVLQGDGAQLQTALANLIRNALQAMGGQPAESRMLRLAVCRSADQVELRVEDSGPGFPSDCCPTTGWELFRSTKANGMGLGLFLAQTAAMNHGGSLRIGRSTHLGGAAVVISLPLNRHQHRQQGQPEAPQGITLPS